MEHFDKIGSAQFGEFAFLRSELFGQCAKTAQCFTELSHVMLAYNELKRKYADLEDENVNLKNEVSDLKEENEIIFDLIACNDVGDSEPFDLLNSEADDSEKLAHPGDLEDISSIFDEDEPLTKKLRF
jgi:hypothetical protein